MPVALAESRGVFAGCCNARDVGGQRTRDGSLIRAGLLFRSDYPPLLARATPDDLGGVATVIDLRSDAETARLPVAGRRTRHLPLDNPQRGMRAADWSDPGRVAARYVEVLLQGTESVSELLAILTDPAAYPAVVHCTAGKDRTGIVVALLLSLLGAADERIVTDYAASGIGAARLAARLHERLGGRPGGVGQYLPSVLSVWPDTMWAFLEQLRVKYGSVDGYLDEIQMSSALPYIRAILLTGR